MKMKQALLAILCFLNDCLSPTHFFSFSLPLEYCLAPSKGARGSKVRTGARLVQLFKVLGPFCFCSSSLSLGLSLRCEMAAEPSVLEENSPRIFRFCMVQSL